MKRISQKLLSGALAALLLCGSLPVYASEALGHDLIASDDTVAVGTQLDSGVFWSDSKSDFRRENYVVYTPSERVKPVVAYGDTTRALTTTLSCAREMEGQGWRVVAGINGDYYGVAHGVPLGSTMVNGALRNANDDPYYAVGFRADGTAIIGDPKLSMRASVNGESDFEVLAFNHIRQSNYGVFLYDHTFNSRHTTGTSEPGVDVLCTVEGGALTIGGQLELTVDEVLPEATDSTVEEGKVILTTNLKSSEEYTAPLLSLQSGDRLTVSVRSGAEDADWSEVVNLIGAPELLVSGGALCSGLPTGSAPRTAIGQRADGSLIFYTIDGRMSGYSVGATLTMVGMRLIELGCVTAVALDGGGSTTLVATLPNETAARVVNTPSDGSSRAVSNHVLLVAPNTPSGVLDHIYLSPSAPRALPGAQITLTASAIDSSYIPMSADIRFSADAGTISGSTLTLPEETGPVTVAASADPVSAAAVIDVLAPEWITVRKGSSEVTSLTLAPNAEVSLTAQGYYNRLALAGDNNSFSWSYEGEGVTLPENGRLVAGPDAAVGTLTVACAGKSLTIPVSVSPKKLITIEDYETAFEPVESAADAPEGEASPASALTLSRAADAAHVRFGRASGRLDYTLGRAASDEPDAAISATLPLSCPLQSGYNCVELWVYGDGGSASLSLLTDAGATKAAALSFDGWTRLTFTLPSGAKRLTGFALGAPAPAAGTLWLDQLVLSYDGVTDDSAPAVSLALDEEANTLRGNVWDGVNATTLASLSLSCDGVPLAYEYNTQTGALTAAAPAADGLAHRITLCAGDASGNLARASVDIPAGEDAEPAFSDVAGHWAAAYVDYLQRAGIAAGSYGKYRPDANITRQEFAVMLYRYLGTEEDFSTVALPFADNAQIADWAMSAVKAMYALGITGGTRDSAGRLCFAPAANISRQEAMTMLGRMLEKGYAAPQLAYADSADIPVWAAEHVRVLSALGVLGGFEDNTFRGAAPLTRAQVAAALYRMN